MVPDRRIIHNLDRGPQRPYRVFSLLRAIRGRLDNFLQEATGVRRHLLQGPEIARATLAFSELTRAHRFPLTACRSHQRHSGLNGIASPSRSSRRLRAGARSACGLNFPRRYAADFPAALFPWAGARAVESATKIRAQFTRPKKK